MWVLHNGAWAESSERNPAAHLIDAGPAYRHVCVRQGGRNRYGQPNYRVVWLPSRIEMAGDWEVNRQDEAGNLIPMGAVTIGLPKYHQIPAAMYFSYVLEVWKPPEWYWWTRQRTEIEWKTVSCQRVLPPVPERGDYEAVEVAPFQPVVFFPRTTLVGSRVFHPMCPALVDAAIRRHKEAVARGPRPLWVFSDIEKQEKEQAQTLYDDIISEALGPYALVAHSGYGGKTRDLGSTATPERGDARICKRD